ncbi:MAG: YggS family pyridoxal phosphate-dependent enzyme [Ignavibacteriae bacterium HGW-Ignavibacteriae-3]|nr:MAG: YggS family pyridoxal phosphate-dependent enzyme [Ignavibacteriae bacterium HGW-Ignavibacteriae-3]
MIAENLKIVENKIAESCIKCGREKSEIRLIAVTKTQPIDVIKIALDGGVKNLGENKAQELRDKSELISGDFQWHFVGHLQSNKVKYVIKSADFIHAVDSIKLAEEINRRSGQLNKMQKILLEIKTSDEETKFGLQTEDEIFKLAEFCKNSSNLNLAGLMTMAPFTENESIIRISFRRSRNLMEKLNGNGYQLKELSMGMTNDYEIAIEEGSTMLRIGTAIFGDRIIN